MSPMQVNLDLKSEATDSKVKKFPYNPLCLLSFANNLYAQKSLFEALKEKYF